MTQEQTKIDNTVIEACKKGNRLAQYTLYNQYSKAMYNLAYRMMNNKEDAEDMLQDAFTDAFNKLNTFRYESTFGAWLKTILINKCINQLRKKKVEIITENVPENLNDNVDENEFSFSGDIQKVFRAIEKLPGGYRIVFTLYLLEGYDHTEIGDILGISKSTSKTQYHRAKNKLKKILAEEDMKWTN